MSDYTVYIKLPPYLRQWFVHDFGGTEPVTLTKNCIEWEILRVYLTKTPANYTEPHHDDTYVSIQLPYFRGHDPRTYNHLNQGTRVILIHCITNRFRVELWADLVNLQNYNLRIDMLLEEWMRQHGITIDDTNFQTVKQIFARMRKLNLNKKYRNKSSTSEVKI